MHGVGESSGAITVVNALSTGVGAAIAVDLPVVAEIDLGSASFTGTASYDLLDRERTPLVEASLRYGLARFGPGSPRSVRLRLRSTIPSSKGLKSSSAVSAAILLAIAHAAGDAPEGTEIAALSADLSQEIRLSETGAFDDALAAVDGGGVVTDNPHRRLLRRIQLDPRYAVLLWIPPGRHPPSAGWKGRFQTRLREGEAAAEAALADDLPAAMARNTGLVEEVLGYDYHELRARLASAGTIAAGVSGMGPTLAAIVPPEHLGAARKILRQEPGEVRTVSLRPHRVSRPRGEE